MDWHWKASGSVWCLNSSFVVDKPPSLKVEKGKTAQGRSGEDLSESMLSCFLGSHKDNEVSNCIQFAKIADAKVTRDQKRCLHFMKERGKVKRLINVEAVDG